MTELTKKKIDYIREHHEEQTLSEMGRALNTAPSGVAYLANKIGVRENVKHPSATRIRRLKKAMEGMYFNVDAIGHDRTWLV